MSQPQTVITDDDVRLWTESHGAGPGLALCHGGPGLWDYLQPVESLVDDLVRVHRFDQRGCGRSDGNDGPFTIDRYVADLEDIRRAKGSTRWIVAGHSWGATLALLYALRNPGRVLGLLYMNGTGTEWSEWKSAHRSESHRRLGPALTRLRELSDRTELTADEERELVLMQWSTDYADARQGRVFAARMLDEGFRINRVCSRLLNAEIDALQPDELRAQCSTLQVPVLIIDGDMDPRPRGAIDSLAQALPEVERVIIPGAGHLPWLEKRNEVRHAIRGWLRTLPS